MITLESILDEYEQGFGYRKGDILIPRPGIPIDPRVLDAISRVEAIVVARTDDPGCYYKVLARHRNPAERFLEFKINGHQWMRRD